MLDYRESTYVSSYSYCMGCSMAAAAAVFAALLVVESAPDTWGTPYERSVRGIKSLNMNADQTVCALLH